jgi:hypothetical protein
VGLLSDSNKIIDLQKAKEMICQRITEDKSDFWVMISDTYEQEYVQINYHYSVCGVHYDQEAGALKLIVNINGAKPVDGRVSNEKLKVVLDEDIPKQFPFLVKDTYYISIDMLSMFEMNIRSRQDNLKREVVRLIEYNELTWDESLQAITELVNESLLKSTYKSINDIMERQKSVEEINRKRRRPIVQILSPGAPCPFCNTYMTVDQIITLYYQSRGRDDCGC